MSSYFTLAAVHVFFWRGVGAEQGIDLFHAEAQDSQAASHVEMFARVHSDDAAWHADRAQVQAPDPRGLVLPDYYDDATSGADDDFRVDDDEAADFADDFDAFDPEMWYRMCPGCSYSGAGDLAVKGSDQLMRSLVAFRDLTRVSATLTKR
jgi:hypothetical protein